MSQNTSPEPENPNQCRHLSPRGQRCRMLRSSDDDARCPYHLRLSRAEPDPEALAAELLDSTGSLNTADRVNALLANTVKQLARKRIDRQDALAIGYLAQLLLNTVPGVQKEYQAIRASQARQALRKSRTESRARLHVRARLSATEPATESSPSALPSVLSPELPQTEPAEEVSLENALQSS